MFVNKNEVWNYNIYKLLLKVEDSDNASRTV